jgi:hypothetical protein
MRPWILPAIALLGIGCGDKPPKNCDKLAEHEASILTEGHTGEVLASRRTTIETVTRQACQDGRYTAGEMTCMLAARTADALEACHGTGAAAAGAAGAPGTAPGAAPEPERQGRPGPIPDPEPEPAPTTPEARGEAAAAIYYQLMAAFITAYGSGDGDCEVRVPRVENALTAITPRRDAMVRLLSDPGSVRALATALGAPTEAQREIAQQHGALFIEGTRSSCDLLARWKAFMAPVDAAAETAMGAAAR